MIFKILAVAAVLFLVYILFFKKSREKEVKNENDPQQLEDTFIECPKCGTYVSKDEAILSNGKYFCSQECLEK